MSPLEWIKAAESNRSEFTRLINLRIDKAVTRQAMSRYLEGTAFPPDTIIAAAKALSRSQVQRSDWEKIAKRARLRSDKDGGFRNHREAAASASKPAKRRA
jgi:hypothetical protein